MVACVEVAVVGTCTGVGKTHVTRAIVGGLRALGRAVWVHKPVACGDWRDGTAEDGRALAALAALGGDGQPAATVCPRQFPEPASPHLAAAAAGAVVRRAELATALAAVRGGHDLVVEGAGGLLSPLASDRGTIADLLAGSGIPLLVVTTPVLGTLNRTALTVEVARARGLPLLGLVLNRPEPVAPSLATDAAAAELVAVTGLPLLADLDHGAVSVPAARSLAAALVRAHSPAVGCA